RARPDTVVQSFARALARNKNRTLSVVLALVALSALVAATGSFRQERAVVAARRKEQRLSRLLASAVQRAERIESHVYALGAYVSGLAASAADALQHGAESTAPFYLLA